MRGPKQQVQKGGTRDGERSQSHEDELLIQRNDPNELHVAVSAGVRLARSAIAGYIRHVRGSRELPGYQKFFSCLAGTLPILYFSTILGEKAITDAISNRQPNSELSASLTSQLSVLVDGGPILIIIAILTASIFPSLLVATSVKKGSTLHFGILGFLITAVFVGTGNVISGLRS